MQIIRGTKTDIYSWADKIEDSAIEQVMNLSKLDIIHSHIALMPDVHAGIGATVGSVIPTYKAVIPAAVGVDIGCGMIALQTDIMAHELPDSLKDMRIEIERKVPVGFAMHKFDAYIGGLDKGLEKIHEKHPKIDLANMPWRKQIGTLGGGNHFIELCLDENNYLWIMLHSGSRGPGNRIGNYFIEKAKLDMQDQLSTLPDADLAYLTSNTELFNDYCFAVNWAQRYASFNRSIMMCLVEGVIKDKVRPFQSKQQAINCHHNYIEFIGDICLTRKGAINASEGVLGIIPGSMGTKSYIVRGKGNKDSHNSCSHGAGRVMSRNQARKKFTLEDLVSQTEGVECRKVKEFVDEIPGAYKDIDMVMEQQKDLVDVVAVLKQILCIKG